MKTKSNLTEKKLTKAELEAREKVIKDLKKNKSALVKRYGKDAEAVMYGRATNIAKKMAESENKNRIKELVRKSLMQEMDIEVGADRYEEEEKLSQAVALLDDLENKLNNHDWFYMMADDNRAFTAGSAKDTEIRNLISKLESIGYGKDAKEMYNAKEPYSKAFGRDAKLKEAKGKDLDKDGDIDSDDYLAARDAAIKKAKLKEYNPDQEQLDDEDEIFMSYDDEGRPLGEDIDLGHTDNEPHMIKGELYQIGKYAMKLYAILEELEETGGEYDFPAWWQSKITTAKNMMSSAKHYLDFELKEPAIDAAVDALTGEEPHMGEPEAPMMEGEVTKVDKLAAKIAKALKDPKNKSSEDQNNIKQARKAMNDDKIETAEKIIKPYLAEKIAKQFIKEAEMNPIKKVINSIFRKNGIKTVQTYTSDVRGFTRNEGVGYKHEYNGLITFKGLPEKTVRDLANQMKDAGVIVGIVRDNSIEYDYRKLK